MKTFREIERELYTTNHPAHKVVMQIIVEKENCNSVQYAKGYQEGYNIGFDIGKDAGYRLGHDDALDSV
jgi:hypothetical protein